MKQAPRRSARLAPQATPQISDKTPGKGLSSLKSVSPIDSDVNRYETVK